MCNHKDKFQGLEHTSQVSHCNTIVFLCFFWWGGGGGFCFLWLILLIAVVIICITLLSLFCQLHVSVELHKRPIKYPFTCQPAVTFGQFLYSMRLYKQTVYIGVCNGYR